MVGWAGLGLTRPWWTGLVGGPTLNEYKHWKDQNDFHFSVSSYQNKNGGGKKCVQTVKPCNSIIKNTTIPIMENSILLLSHHLHDHIFRACLQAKKWWVTKE